MTAIQEWTRATAGDHSDDEELLMRVLDKRARAVDAAAVLRVRLAARWTRLAMRRGAVAL